MENHVAVIGIIVEDYNSVGQLNEILHQHRHLIIGRLGIPYRPKNISVMSIVVDTDLETINNMSESISRLNGVSTRTAVSGNCICGNS